MNVPVCMHTSYYVNQKITTDHRCALYPLFVVQSFVQTVRLISSAYFQILFIIAYDFVTFEYYHGVQ